MPYNPFIMRHLSIYFMLLACFHFATLGALSKILSEQMTSVEIVFFRNLIGLIIILIALNKDRNFGHGGKPVLLIFRGVIGSVGLLLFFYNVAHIDLGTAFTFQKTSPIYIALFSYFLLKERLSLLGWSAIILGFIGIALVVQPNIGITANDLIGIGGGICMGMALTSVRELRKYYSANMIILSFMFFGVLTMSVLLVLGEFGIGEFKFVFPNFFGWVLIALVGLGGYYYQVYLTKSYAATKKAGIPAAISYMDIIFSMILGLLLGDALPNNVALLGIATIIFSGLLIAKEK